MFSPLGKGFRDQTSASTVEAGCARKVDIRLPGQGDSNSHGERPVHQIISMIKWIRTSRLSIKNSLARDQTSASTVEGVCAVESRCNSQGVGFRGWGWVFGFRASGFGFRVSGFGFEVWLRDRVLGCRVLLKGCVS